MTKHLRGFLWRKMPIIDCETWDKLSEKFNSRLLVQEEHGFQEGAQSPLATGAKKPWPG